MIDAPPKEVAESSTGATSKNSKRKRQTPAQLAARVSRACDRCRGRKYKCDGGHPCSSCSVNGLSCTYDPVFRRRGLPEGYVRGLERLLGLALSRDPTFEELVLSFLANGQNEDFEMDAPSHGWNVEKDEETLHESWKKSPVSSQVESLIPVLESFDTRGLKRRRVDAQTSSRTLLRMTGNAHVLQHGNSMSQQLVPANALECVALEDSVAIASPSHHPELQKSEVSAGHSPNTDHPDSKTLEHLAFKAIVPRQLPERAGRLLDAYFTFTHCWLPFIDRYDMMRLSFRYPHISGDLSAGSRGSGEVAALWALLAYADTPTVEWPTPDEKGGGNEITTRQLYLAARALIPSETMVFELGHVQALLLLVLYNMRYATLDAGWILMGQAARIAITLGLDKPGQAMELTDQPRKPGGRHLHVYLACFALDTFLSARLNRAPHLRKQSLAHAGALVEDGPEEWEPWFDSQAPAQALPNYCNPSFITSTFNRLIEALIILNEVVCDTSLGIEWEQRHSILRTRLAESAAKFKNNSQNQNSRPLPHHAVLHIVQLSTLAVMRLHGVSLTRTKLAAQGNLTLSAQLTKQLQKCLEVFGAAQYPPLFGFPALLALKEDEAFNLNSSNDGEWKKELLEIAIKLEVRNSGFREIQNAIALSVHSTMRQSKSQPKQQDVVPRDAFVVDTEPNTPSFWETVVQDSSQFSKPRRESMNADLPSTMSQSNLHRYNHTRTSPTAISTSADTPNRLLGGEFGDIGPFETATAIITEESPSLNQSSVKPRNFTTATATNLPLIEPRPAQESSSGDSDVAFLSLAHLDTTQWSNNWEDGLAELGFANDSMFREFCNDPDRLFSGDGT